MSNPASKFTQSVAVLALASLTFASAAQARDGAGRFSSHKAYKVSGKATLSGTTLRLSGFKTTPGPDLYVYVGKGGPSKRIAKLKANSGSQSYTVPKGDWTSVHIHCKKFNSTFGSARLK